MSSFPHLDEEFQHRWDRGNKNSDDLGKEIGSSSNGGRDPSEPLVTKNQGAKHGKSGKYGFHGDTMGGFGAHEYRKKLRVTKVYSKKDPGKSTTSTTNEERDLWDSCKEGIKTDALKKSRLAVMMHGIGIDNSCPGVSLNELGMGHIKPQQPKEVIGQWETTMSPRIVTWVH